MTKKDGKALKQNSTFSEIVKFAANLEPAAEPDKFTVLESEKLVEYQRRYVHESIRTKTLDNDQKELDQSHQLKYARSIGWLIPIWLLIVLIITVWSGFKEAKFKLEDKVLIALIGSTTANVIGIYAIVAKYLFSRKK